MRRFTSGRGSLLGHGIVYPVPIPLAPAPYRGAMVAGLDPADGRVKPYFSDGDEWLNNVFSSEITEMILVELANITLEPFTNATLPNPALTVNERRFAFNTDLGLPGFVWGDEWQYLTDEARSAQIAEDIVADVFRVQGEKQKVIVDRTATPIEGQVYSSLGEAMEYTSRFFPAVRADEEFLVPQSIWIEIAAAHGNMREQILLRGSQAANVVLTAEAPEVVVEGAYLTKSSNFNGRRHAFFHVSAGGAAPLIYGVKFACDGNVPPPDPKAVALAGTYTPETVGFRVDDGTLEVEGQRFDYDGNALSAPRLSGATGFHFNLFTGLGGSAGSLIDSSFDDADHTGIRVRAGNWVVAGTTATGCGTAGIIASDSAFLQISAVRGGQDAVLPGLYSQDFRRTPGVDDNDIQVQQGGRISVSGPGNQSRGGYSQEPNVWRPSGAIVDYRVTTPPTLQGLIAPQSYTVATLPSAAANSGVQVYVTDGAAGLPIMAFSDGTGWLRCDTRAAVSAT